MGDLQLKLTRNKQTTKSFLDQKEATSEADSSSKDPDQASVLHAWYLWYWRVLSNFVRQHMLLVLLLTVGRLQWLFWWNFWRSYNFSKYLSVYFIFLIYNLLLGFPCGTVVKNLLANARDTGSVSWWVRSPGRRNGNSLPYSCIENPINRGDLWTTVHRVT